MDDLSQVIGGIPYRMALAGGWIDQPFVSAHNPNPPGSMVVVGLQPVTRFMDRCGMATSTRRVAQKLWGNRLPGGDPLRLARELYGAENAGKSEPSGAQDMIGLIVPGINRLDFDCRVDGGYFPSHIETCLDFDVARWLEGAVALVPVNQRPAGYNPLETRRLEPDWIERLGHSGKDCFSAIVNKDLAALGQSFNECMRCWEAILPGTVRHPTIDVDLTGLLAYYQRRYAGAMYSGCGGGYLVVAADEPVPGSFRVQVRLD